MRKKIIFYGPLKKLTGVPYFEADVSKVSEVFSFIKVNFPSCKEHLTKAHYSVIMGDTDITFKNLVIQGKGDIKVIPMISGNFFFAFFGTLFAGFINTKITAMVAFKQALAVGALSLLSQALAPVPQNTAPSTDPQVESFISNQTPNSTKSGGAAPLIFGEALVGSVVIMAGTDTVEVMGN
tara:strand:- start:607 stop:1149 length:543 start_codon:yes stop_codon:yes gene_type:complete